ncbi:hypothetical protein K456DRAFT_319884 [Colletotrichum gloeosporioides 23]|nr:hypothetical protein K456DRAFT_319884 [Colletotrichum gloeosporioides 23]
MQPRLPQELRLPLLERLLRLLWLTRLRRKERRHEVWMLRRARTRCRRFLVKRNQKEKRSATSTADTAVHPTLPTIHLHTPVAGLRKKAATAVVVIRLTPTNLLTAVTAPTATDHLTDLATRLQARPRERPRDKTVGSRKAHRHRPPPAAAVTASEAKVAVSIRREARDVLSALLRSKQLMIEERKSEDLQETRNVLASARRSSSGRGSKSKEIERETENEEGRGNGSASVSGRGSKRRRGESAVAAPRERSQRSSTGHRNPWSAATTILLVVTVPRSTTARSALFRSALPASENAKMCENPRRTGQGQDDSSASETEKDTKTQRAAIPKTAAAGLSSRKCVTRSPRRPGEWQRRSPARSILLITPMPVRTTLVAELVRRAGRRREMWRRRGSGRRRSLVASRACSRNCSTDDLCV